MRAIEKIKEELKQSAIACKVNNKIVPIDYEVMSTDIVESVDITKRDGRRVYQRGLLFIMVKAFYEVYPELRLKAEYQLSNSIFCTIKNTKITEEMIEKIKEKMNEIVSNKLDIVKKEMSKKEAEEFYEKQETNRGKLQLENVNKENVSLYFCEEYFNYFYGVMPVNTSQLKLFDIIIYNNGLLVRYPDINNPDKIEEYKETKKLQSALEEYEKIHKVLEVNTIEKLNNKIKEGKQKEIVLLAEALHEKKISDIADEIIKKDGVKMVLIAGPSSSGKTTFAQRLSIHLKINGIKTKTLSVDNYFVEREETPKDEKGEYDFERIDAIDLKLFNDHLTKLLNGEEVQVPEFDFKTGTKKYNDETFCIKEDEVLVIEGIHCLNDELTKSIDRSKKYKIYISALTVLNIDYFNRISTTDTRFVRRMVRDFNFRGYSAETTLTKWESVNNGERKYIFPFQEEADSMFNTSLIYEICVLKKYAKRLLEDVKSDNKDYAEARNILNLLSYFEDIEDKYVPMNSLLREFIGGNIFEEE